MRRVSESILKLRDSKKRRKLFALVFALLAVGVMLYTANGMKMPASALSSGRAGDDTPSAQQIIEVANEPVEGVVTAGDEVGDAVAEGGGDAIVPSSDDAEDDSNAAEGVESADGQAVSATAEAGGATVSMDAPAGANLPADAELRVEEVDPESEEYESYRKKALEAIDADGRVVIARFFDISIVSGGEEVKPEEGVQVSIEVPDAPAADEGAEASVVHFEGAAKKGADVVDATEEAGTTTFEAESFSVYGVVYTVDFHWGVDGEEFEFSLPGGGFVSLTDVVSGLGIVTAGEESTGDGIAVGEDEDASGARQQFIADVKSVEFSSPDLLSVSKVEQDTTVGTLKDELGLECEYSADLTEEQIAEIEAQKVNAGDWALISVKPFASEETLTVTMENEEQFEIRVTDGQLHTYVISDSGDTYEVTVTYDDTAEIPEDAELVVKEIQRDSKEYDDNVDLANKELWLQEKPEVVNPVQYDISIVADGVEVEPKEGSTVNVVIRLASEVFEGETSEDDGEIWYNGELLEKQGEEEETARYIGAHITDDGKAEIIKDIRGSVDQDDKIVLQFDTDSFSTYIVDGVSASEGANHGTVSDLPTTMYVGDVIYIWNNGSLYVNTNGCARATSINNNNTYREVRATSVGSFQIGGRWIQVQPARQGTTLPPTIGTIDNASIGLTMNLFDYDLDEVLDDYYNSGAHYDDNIISYFANHGINAGNALKFWGSGIGNNYGNLNQYVEHGVTSIVNNTLTGGYPILSNTSGGSGNRDLSYLFTPSDGTDKKAYTNVNGLFKKEGDYYVYDSGQNYAWFNPSTNSFEVYNKTYNQKTGREQGEFQNKPIGFFPFHRYDEDYDLYVNWNKNLNHHFGLSMSVPFSLPKDPKAVVDTNSNPIVFEFSGDDDLWVFIDGKLAMDIGGIHQPTSGTINFQTGVVTVNNETQMNASAFNSRFSNLYDGNMHTLQVFYIERGGADSNCKIKFNLTQYGDIHFDKVDKDNPSDKLAGAVFGLYKDEECTTPVLEQLKNRDPRAYIAESSAQGKVQFSDIPIGTYYLKELHAPEGYPLDSTVHTVQVYYDQTSQPAVVRVTIDGKDVGVGVNILNGKPAPINLGLHKVWQNADGESIVAPEGADATFEIKRIRNYETYTEQTIEGEGRQVSHLTVGWIHSGQTHVHAEYDLIAGTTATISWGYNDGYTGSKDCIVNGVRIDKDYVAGNVISEGLTMPAAGGTSTIYIVDESDNGEAIRNINVAGAQFYGNEGGGVIHTFTTYTEPDPSFSYTGEHVTNNRVTLPVDSNTWSYIFANLPAFGRGRVDGVDHDVSFNYSYYLEEVSSTSPAGTTVVYKDLDGNVISSPTDAETSESGTLNITNKVPTGYLRINKEVTYNGVAPTTDVQKSALAGEYTFKVYTDANCSKPYKVIQGEAPNQQEVDLELTVTIEDDGEAKSSETVKIPVGKYWIEEQTPGQTGVTPEANRIEVIIEANQTTSKPGVASFTNNKEESNNPDELAIELEKTFTGLQSASKIPEDYQAVLTYTNNESTVTVPLTGSTQGNVTCTKSADGMTWHWRVTHVPTTATNFGVYESNYDIDGYTRITKINGVVVENPGTPQAVTVLTPEITMTGITSVYTTADNAKVFTVADNQILLVRMTSHATVIVSQKSLSLATRQAIEKLLQDNDGKIPGDGAHAEWVMNFVYFSHEIHGDKFSYGGRTIFFEGNQVKVPHNASSHETRVDINYNSTSAQNSFTLENDYTEIPTDVDVLKVQKGNEATTQLSDAVFELRKLEDVAPTSPGGTLTYVKDSNQQVIVSSKTTGSDGRLTFSGLTYGYYEIREVTPPPGYVVTEDVTFYLKVDAGTVTYLQKGEGKPSTWGAATNIESATVYFKPAHEESPAGESAIMVNATFRVSNTPGVELPHTGGIGNGAITLFGTILVAGAGLLLVSRRRAM